MGSEGNAYVDIREGDMAVKHAVNSKSWRATKDRKECGYIGPKVILQQLGVKC